MSSLLETIEERLRVGSNSRERAELLGEKACYLARAGEQDGAIEVVNSMREEWGNGNSPRAMVWIILAEGLIKYFSDLRDESWDRIRRAQQLSVSLQLSRLDALTSAWMAHLEFHRSNYASLREHLKRVFESEWRPYPDVCLRIGMVLGDSAVYCGKDARAQYWYGVAHSLAVRTGDRLALGAVMYNRAVHGLNCLIVNGIVSNSQPSHDQLRRFALELESARQYESLIGATAFAQALDLARGRYLLAIGDFVGAAAILGPLRRIRLTSPVLDLVTAYGSVCDFHLGDIRSAGNGLKEYRESAPRVRDVDDLLLLNSAYMEVANGLGFTDEHDLLKESIEGAKLHYMFLRGQLINAIEHFVDLDYKSNA